MFGWLTNAKPPLGTCYNAANCETEVPYKYIIVQVLKPKRSGSEHNLEYAG